MAARRFRVGIVGLQPGRSWAARAHLPALRLLSDDFEIAGVANTSRASAVAAAEAEGIPRAFGDVAELAASPDIDIVAVTVKVPHHLELASAALAAGKHVYCEWPLGNGLAEAEEMAALADRAGVLAVVGTQAVASPAIIHLRNLLAQGYVGEVLSSTITGWGRSGGPTFDPQASGGRYLLDQANGATMLTIPVGHTLAAVRDVLGPLREVSARVMTRIPTVTVPRTGETLAKTAPDQVLADGIFDSGAPISIHYRGGLPRDPIGFVWDINGRDGDMRLTGPSGHTQMVELSLSGARGDERVLQPIDIPASCFASLPGDVIPGNVARVYARMAADLRQGTRTAPRFDDAIAIHRMIDAIEMSSLKGQRVALA